MAENIQSQNPLSAYFRAPKLYTTIPEDDFMGYYDCSDNDRLFSMTTRTELMLKNPDALLNGKQ